MNNFYSYYIRFIIACVIACALPHTLWADERQGQEVTVVGDQNYSGSDVLVYDGIDVSSYQHDIDWSATARDKNIKFVYIKATEGATHTSRRYRRNIEHARAQGVKVGSYHFFRTTSSIQSQFNNFTRVVKLEEQDLLPLIDVETCKGWSAQMLRDSVKLFADMLEAHYGCRPMIYASSSFFNSYLGATFADYPLFIARYAKSEPRLNFGANWILWQFTDRGRIKGIDTMVDLSRFNKGCDVSQILINGKKNNKRRRGSGRQETVPPPPPKPKNVAQREVPATSKRERDKAEKERREAEKRAEKERREAAKRAEKERKEAEKRAHEQAERERKEQERLQREQERLQREQERERREAEKRAERERKEELERERKIARQNAEAAEQHTEQPAAPRQDEAPKVNANANAGATTTAPAQTAPAQTTPAPPAKVVPEAPYDKAKRSKSNFKRVNKHSSDNDNVDYPTKRNK